MPSFSKKCGMQPVQGASHKTSIYERKLFAINLSGGLCVEVTKEVE